MFATTSDSFVTERYVELSCGVLKQQHTLLRGEAVAIRTRAVGSESAIKNYALPLTPCPHSPPPSFTGWPHVVATPSDSFVIGGNFLTSCHLPTHLAIWAMEGRLKVSPSCQYPGFITLIWAAADHFSRRLQQQLAAANGGSNGSNSSNARLYQCELEGLPSLVESLRQSLTAGEATQDVPDPAGKDHIIKGFEACADLDLVQPSRSFGLRLSHSFSACSVVLCLSGTRTGNHKELMLGSWLTNKVIDWLCCAVLLVGLYTLQAC